jgi:hypothetical protein
MGTDYGDPEELEGTRLNIVDQGERLGEEVHRRLSGRPGIYASKSCCDFPSEEILLDSLLALRFAEPCPLVAHTDFSA